MSLTPGGWVTVSQTKIKSRAPSLPKQAYRVYSPDMRRSLAHLPNHKKLELRAITKLIREIVPTTEMIILFGSYARGNWVEDVYQQGHITYEYKSDFDILVVTEDKKTARDTSLWFRVEAMLAAQQGDRTPVELIQHHIQELNQKIDSGNYFFHDIKREGIWLYNSGKHRLARIRKLNPKERHDQAVRDFDMWIKKAEGFFNSCTDAAKRGNHNIAAFLLHQSTEHALTAVLLVFSGYKPKTHNIETLTRRAGSHNAEFLRIFPRQTARETHLFKLLKKAYIDARYNDRYIILPEELTYLSERVNLLCEACRRICTDQIRALSEAAMKH